MIFYIIPKHYLPDFIFESKQGKVYVEAKGHFRVGDKQKMKHVKLSNPDLDIRFILAESKPVQLARDKKWCEKLGFPWAVGRIPKEWFD